MLQVTCHMSNVTSHLSYVECCMSHVACRMSHAACHMSHVTWLPHVHAHGNLMCRHIGNSCACTWVPHVHVCEPSSCMYTLRQCASRLGGGYPPKYAKSRSWGSYAVQSLLLLHTLSLASYALNSNGYMCFAEL